MARTKTHPYSLCIRNAGESCFFPGDGQTQAPCSRQPGEQCFRSADGRFCICNTWSVEAVREPNWLLTDFVTGQNYRFFLRVQVERKIETLRAQTDPSDTSSRHRA